MISQYFDYNSTTPVAEEVIQAMAPFWVENFGNPSSLHQPGRAPAQAIKKARRRLAELLVAEDEKEILFTSCGTESNNAVFRSVFDLSQKEHRKILVSSVEHSSVLQVCAELEKKGWEIEAIPVHPNGELNWEVFEKAFDENTALISLMMANNETGICFDIQRAAEIARNRNVLLHVDAVQVVGKLPITLKNSGIHFLSLSAHKFYGPKGVGALYVRQNVPFRSSMIGGRQERGRRAGTENVAGIVGLGAAAELARKDLETKMPEIESLRNLFEDQLADQIEHIFVYGKSRKRIPNTSNIRFQGVDGETLMYSLDKQGISVSGGSACMSGAHEPSHVLKAMGCTDAEAKSSIRFSFGRYTTKESVQQLLQVLKNTVQRFRTGEKIST